MKDHHIFIIFIFFVDGVFSQEDPVVQYLRSFSRLDNASFIDYYFSCAGKGPTTQWQINNYVVTLNETDMGKAKVCPDMEIQCIATLLSFTSSKRFYSILMVSTTSTTASFSVNCTTATRTSNTISPMGNIENATLSQVRDNILLQYLFQTDTVNNLTTQFFICGVNDILQAWRTTGVPSGYLPSDMIGEAIVEIVNDVAVEAAFLVGFEPYELVSILLVTQRPHVNVTCASSSLQAIIFSTDIPAATAPTVPSTVSEATDKTEPGNKTDTMNTQENTSTTENMRTTATYTISTLSRETIAITVVVIIIAFIILLGILIVVIALYCLYKADKRAEESDRRADKSDKRAEESDRRAEESDKRAEESDRKAEESDRRAEESDRRAKESDRRVEEAERMVEELKNAKNANNKKGSYCNIS